MKTAIIFALSLCWIFPAYADKSAAETLLEITDFEKSVMDGAMAGFVMVEKSLVKQNLTAEEMAEVEKAFKAYIQKMAADPELKKKAITAYEKAFTEEELRELATFYETPLGKKTITVLPSLMKEVMGFSYTIAQKHVSSFQEELGKILERKENRGKAEDGK